MLDILREIQFDSIVDVGCGDGRFLSEAQIYFSGKTLLGIDYSERAVKLARVMEPNVEYQTVNILDRPLGHQFDVATCIEVLEHIQPGYVEKFCESLASVIKSGGKLVLTVPHSNTAVNAKHYQHFNSKQPFCCNQSKTNINVFRNLSKKVPLCSFRRRLLQDSLRCDTGLTTRLHADNGDRYQLQPANGSPPSVAQCTVPVVRTAASDSG